jgi:hypothetical protein
MMHANDDELRLYAKGGLANVLIPELEAHLNECSICADRLRHSESFLAQVADLRNWRRRDDGPERRREIRLAVNHPASLKQLLPTASGRSEVRVLDISRNGLKVEVSERIDPGTVVQIRIEELIVTGEVRYWVSVGDKFHEGVQIQDVIPTRTCGHAAS